MSALLKNMFLFTLVAALLATTLGDRPAMAGLIGLEPNTSDSVPLSELLENLDDGIQVGDKIFDEFVYSTIGDMPDAEDVMVLGFKDLDGNFGFTLHGIFLDLPGDGASDALLRYTASVDEAAQQAGRSISDAHLFLGGVGVVGPNSIFVVDESFEGLDNSMTVFSASEEQVTSAWTYFDPTVNKLRVTKDILAFTGAGTILPARATAIDQSFSQVPEPVALSLMAMSLIGALLVSRRRQG
jgi:hypothetical protein